METWIDILTAPDTAFLRRALWAGLLAAPAFGVTGSYVVARRLSGMAGSIAHCILGGIGLALFLQAREIAPWFTPAVGSLVSALAAALILGVVSLRSREREDTVIGALWALGMSAGLLFIAHTPGYIDPMRYLFGDILMVSPNQLRGIAALDGIILLPAVLLYPRFLAVCFDEEFARVRGLKVEGYYLLLLALAALTIVQLVQVVGIVMVIALLTVPAATAGFFVTRLWQMMLGATLYCGAAVVAGLLLAYRLNWPAGPAIILTAGTVYLALLAVRSLTGNQK
ncbi:High-affinity zinc uptake system membrane protein [Kiritimatiella glycovorans]|uniref:High-affinity zinc uptake system membrane protein n=2 Tax=Kiritimatiella glycovorans TaxID=1307763 RepID=A0A0G3EBB0_9BACT|nr:High-affinity zinc uptake system membrane protein [Kiritimatiella glycovorans]